MSAADDINWKKPMFMAIGLAVLGGFAYWLEFSHAPAQEEEERLSKKVFQIDETQVESVEIGGHTHKVFLTGLEMIVSTPGSENNRVEGFGFRGGQETVRMFLLPYNSIVQSGVKGRVCSPPPEVTDPVHRSQRLGKIHLDLFAEIKRGSSVNERNVPTFSERTMKIN